MATRTTSRRSSTRSRKPTGRMPRTTAHTTLRTRLARLNLAAVQKLLGPKADELLRLGESNYGDDIDVDRDVYLRGDLFRLNLSDRYGPIRVTFTLRSDRNKRLVVNCDRCEGVCEHIGAACSLILEDKYTLGLSDIPKPDVPFERLTDEELEQRALAEREKRSRDESFRLTSVNPKTPWTDYLLTSVRSGKTYRLAIRGIERGQSFCSCPDFRTNRLGTCKHLMYAERRLRQKFTRRQLSRKYRPKEFAVHLTYGESITLHLETPETLTPADKRIVKAFLDRPIDDVHGLLASIRKLETRGNSVVIYPDAEEFIQKTLYRERVESLVRDIRKAPHRHPLRKNLLNAELLPYQLDGIAFAVGAGRAILADDMGLGKTIQGIGVAMLLKQVAQIGRVLVVCPASLKSQWRNEIERFCEAKAQVVAGSAQQRAEQYDSGGFFCICNYEQVLRDLDSIEPVAWDLIILDEGQRIKNWESKTSRCIKALRSPFALVLSGTPLENRLDELYSIVQFVDDRRLPPAYRFFQRHREVDERGKVIGYKNLDELRERLEPILLRRTRDSVLQQLPERTTHTLRIPPTEEQKEISDDRTAKVARILSKRFLTEMDLLRVQKALLQARMACNSTFLVDHQPPGKSTKLEYLAELAESLFADPSRKAVLFSEWTRMLDLIEPILDRLELQFVRLDGKVPQRKRQQLVNRFQTDPACRLFLTTNAGSTGLNLQSANTVINVDLPWNPAVLEQRIARAHRMGQKNPVDVYLLVTEDTFEEKMLDVLAQKQSLALAALDPDSDVSELDFESGVEELKRRLEQMLGPKAIAPIDESSLRRCEQEVQQYSIHREKVAAAGGQLLGALFGFVGELVGEGAEPPEPVVAKVRDGLEQCVQHDDQGRAQLVFTLPDQQNIDQLAKTLAGLLLPAQDTPDRLR